MYKWLSAFLFIAFSGVAEAQFIYWVDAGSNKLQRARLDGQRVEDVLAPDVTHPTGIAIHAGEGRIYWGDRNRGIQSASFDGNDIATLDIQPFFESSRGIFTLAIDHARNHLYWVERSSTKSAIRRYLLDDEVLENVITLGLDEVYDIEIDSAGEKMYWSEGTPHSDGPNLVRGANLDGSFIEDIFSTTSSPGHLAFDPMSGFLYRTQGGSIYRMDLNGAHELVFGTGASVAVNPAVGDDHKLYWQNLYAGRIERANKDGSQKEVLIASGLLFPYGFAVDSQSNVMFWSNSGWIQRSEIDGTNVETILRSALGSPYRLAVDSVNRRIYWTEDYQELSRIQRLSLGTAQWDDLLRTRLVVPRDLGLDPAGKKIYWNTQDYNGSRIKAQIWRGNLDAGEQLQLHSDDNLDPGSAQIWALAIDPHANNLFWIDKINNYNIIQKSSPGPPLMGLPFAGEYLQFSDSLALDELHQKVYWIETTGLFERTIRRCNYDGSNTADVVRIEDNGNGAAGLAIEPTLGHLYWTNRVTGSIHRANLDGTAIQTLLSGLELPRGIALDLRWGGDSDENRQIDLVDFAHLQTCFATDETGSPECEKFDSDPLDSDVDLDDFKTFAALLGLGIPTDH